MKKKQPQLPNRNSVARGLSAMVVALTFLIQCSPSSDSNKDAMNQSTNTQAIPEGANRLIREKSPYLLQHAHNPVDWYPWGPEAFAKAASEDKPIFLSIGYSTCHWCHVMEHECFEDTTVARLMNEAFVSIKVDREERPDIDNIYMTVCQMMTHGGGWPLTIIMTPDKKPFFAGTYIPKESRFQRMGMVDLIPRVSEAWKTQRSELLASAARVISALSAATGNQPGASPGERSLQAAYSQMVGRFDETYGGFGTAPKFPTPHNLTLLLRIWKRTGDPQALAMVEKTLSGMRLGGMYDHAGFGFHRYSTDQQWMLPHFEKMLYDQAQLVMAYTEAYQATHKVEYERTAREILTYVLRDMTSPEGGFYSAEDADSEGEEGTFYVWTTQEIRDIFDPDDTRLIFRIYHFENGGNFLDQATQKKTGANILYLTKPLDSLSAELGMTESALRDKLEDIRGTLFRARNSRIHPYKDDKVLTDWNGLMIAAFAQAAQVFDAPEYAAAAQRAANFILQRLRPPNGRLLHRYRDGEAGLPAHADDYAFLIEGLLNLYEATFDTKYVETAKQLNDELVAHFWDNANGGFFFTADDSEELITRQKESYDGAAPSGNSVAMLNLIRLGRITANAQLEKMADGIGRAFAPDLERGPMGMTQMLQAVDFAMGPAYEVVIAGDSSAADTKTMLRELRSAYIPSKVVILRPANETSPAITKLAAFTASQHSIDGKATAYVCQNYACQLPTTDPAKMMELLGAK